MFDDEMPFGKYRGYPIRRLPNDYLRWLILNVELREPLKTAIYSECKRRVSPPPPPPAPSPPITGITADKLRELRRRLSLRFHPDHGGSTAEMRVVNVVFDELEAVK